MRRPLDRSSLFWRAFWASRHPLGFSVFWVLGALPTAYRPLSHSTPSWRFSIPSFAQNLLADDAEPEPELEPESEPDLGPPEPNILPGAAAGATETSNQSWIGVLAGAVLKFPE